MKNYEQNINKVKEILRNQRYYESIGALMDWDSWQGLPIDGRNYRQEVSGYFVKEALKLIKDNDTKKLVEYLRELDDKKFQNIYDQAASRILVKNYDIAVKVPVDLQIEMNDFTAKTLIVWRAALNESDFNIYKPYLRRMFELKTQIAQAIDKTKNPFDVLISDFNEGLTVNKVEQLFKEIKEAIINILAKVENKYSNIDNSFLRVSCSKESIKKICTSIVEKAFFDKNKATYSEVIHPECIGVGPADIRITTHFNDLFPSIFAMLHECGHGLYSYSSNEKAVDYGIWGGISGAMHESQSRFYENFIGKSKEFWQFFYPLLQEEIKEFQNIDLDTLYNGINKINPSVKRMNADELTYSLHPIIRFEMEKEYFDGKLKTDDFYEAWNAKYREYLGIEPQNAKEGVLQDVHWAAGLIGYFQSYTLGNIYGGQFRNKMLQDIPELYQQIANGDFSALNKWNYKKVHQYGKLYRPNELMMRVTGEEIQSKYFIDYLNKKFLLRDSKKVNNAFVDNFSK